MFQGEDDFNPDHLKWDVNKVTSMKSMFGYTKLFNNENGTEVWNVCKYQGF